RTSTNSLSKYRAAALSIALAFDDAAEIISELEPGPTDELDAGALERALLNAARAYDELAGRTPKHAAPPGKTVQTNAPAQREAPSSTEAGRLAKAAGHAAQSADKALGQLIRNGYTGDMGPRVPTGTVPALKLRESSSGTSQGAVKPPSTTT